jgi:hypothetical protein
VLVIHGLLLDVGVCHEEVRSVRVIRPVLLTVGGRMSVPAVRVG